MWPDCCASQAMPRGTPTQFGPTVVKMPLLRLLVALCLPWSTAANCGFIHNPLFAADCYNKTLGMQGALDEGGG